MSLGPYCKALGIDEDVLNGQKTVTCGPEQFINGVAWELRKYKVAKKCSSKEIADWIIRILDLKCENGDIVEKDLNEKIEKLAGTRGTFLKTPKNYPGEIERLMKWRFDFPESTGVEAGPVFEPMERAHLGPKLLKVLKEKGADVDDSMDLSGPSDDDDEQAKRRKAREEIIQLKKDLGTARKAIMGLNDKLNDVSKRCALLSDVTKISVSESRRIENDLTKLRAEWNIEISAWHDCIERLNHANVNKSNYLDVGYMVRRNKNKQGIFDELSFEFERAIEEFKNKVNSLLNKERQKKKPVPREYKQKSKSDRKRVRQEGEDEKSEESKKICLPEDSVKPEPSFMPVEEFMKSEIVEEFKNGKFAASLKAIYVDLTMMAIPCKNVQEVFFSVLNSLEGLNVEKIPTLFFAGNIYMEVRTLAMIQAFSDLIKVSKVTICNNSETKFNFVAPSYEVVLSNDSQLTLGIRDLSSGSQDTSLNFLKDLFSQVLAIKFDSNPALNQVVHALRKSGFNFGLQDGKLLDIIFLYKQQVFPKLKSCLENCNSENSSKFLSLNSFCTGIYFLVGLAQLVDVTILVWELVSQNLTPSQSPILSQTVQNLNSFCETLDSSEEYAEFEQEFNTYIAKEKKIENTPLAPFKDNLFNTVFHNSAGIWFFHEVGVLTDFFESIKEKEIKISPGFAAFKDSKQSLAVVKALGLIGKLIAAPIWTMLEDQDADISEKYAVLLKKIEIWSKDAEKFMKGQEYIFDDQQMSHDAVFISLIKDNEASDGMTKEILELLFTAFVPYIQSFVYGSTKSDSKVNGGTESDVKVALYKDFEMFDCITKSFHSFSNFALDALASYSKARNGEWQDKLNTRANSQVAEIIQRNASKQLKALYKRKIYLNELKDRAQEKSEEFSKCQVIEKRYKLIDDLIRWGGLWKTEKELDDRLKDMKDSDRMLALKSQIKFRRHVLGEVHENNLLDLAYDGEMFNYTKMYENLKAVLRNECQVTETDNFELASATDDENLKAQIYEACKNAREVGDHADHRQNYAIKNNFYWLLGKKIQHTFVKAGIRESNSGVCIARKKINGVYSYFVRCKDGCYKYTESKIAEEYRNKNLQVVEPSSKELVGMRLSRAFYKDDGYLEWYDCRIIASTGGPEYVVEFDYYGSDVTQEINEEIVVPDVEALTFTCRVIENYRTGQLRFL